MGGKMRIYLVRHGQSTANEKKVMAGHADVELTEKGKVQAKIVAEKLANEQLDVILCSPLDRAQETASIINSVRTEKLPIIITNSLMEVDYGIYEGVKKSNFNYKQFWNYLDENNINSFFSFAWPIIRFIYGELLTKYYGQNILLVTHGGVSKIFEMILGDYSLSPTKIGSYLPDNSELLIYNISKNNSYYFHNNNSIDDNENNSFFRIITPNIIGKAYDEINQKFGDETINFFVDEKPKLRNRVGIILYNDNNEIAITKYSNTKEVKFLGGSIDYNSSLEENVERILDERFGFSANIDTFKSLGNTIEIRPYDTLANINISKIIMVKFNEKIHDLSPNEKEVQEGFSLEWLNVDKAIEYMQDSFKYVCDYKDILNKEYWRPLLTKQSIVYRDLQILEYYRSLFSKNN